MKAILLNSEDPDVEYGILTVENVDSDTVQKEIYRIKREFEDDDWCITDVFNKFPKDWEWSFYSYGANIYLYI